MPGAKFEATEPPEAYFPEIHGCIIKQLWHTHIAKLPEFLAKGSHYLNLPGGISLEIRCLPSIRMESRVWGSEEGPQEKPVAEPELA